MPSKNTLAQNIILFAGLAVLTLYLFIPMDGYNPAIWTYRSSLQFASGTLRGFGPRSDLVQDIIGFRALVTGGDPYPVLGDKVAEQLGINWRLVNASPHPPTAFLCVAPVALFSWPVASAVWGWLMVLLLVGSLHLYRLPWRLAIGLTPFILLWPPAALSLGQITIPWLFFSALAYRFSHRPGLHGASIALGAMVKFFPAILLLPSLFKRDARSVGGFALAAVLSIPIIFTLNPSTFTRYLEVNQGNVSQILFWCDNGSLFMSLFRVIGIPGLYLASAFLILVVFLTRPRLDTVACWMLFVYLSVALLPLLWNYSLLPLLPVIGWLVMRKKIIPAMFGLLALIVPSLYPMVFCESSFFTASSVVFAGLGLISVRYTSLI